MEMLWDMSSQKGGCAQFGILESAVLPADKKTGLWSSCVTSLQRGEQGVGLRNCWGIKCLFNTKQPEVKMMCIQTRELTQEIWKY